MSAGTTVSDKDKNNPLDQPGVLARLAFNRNPLVVALHRLLYERHLANTSLPPHTLIEPLNIEGVPSRWVIPQDSSNDRFVFYLHGGGFLRGSANSHTPYLARLCAATRARGLIIDYRRTPEFPFPNALHDAIKVFRWMFEKHVNPDNIVIAGDGAGANLLLSTLLTLRKEGHPQPAACALVSPWVDLSAENRTLQYAQTGKPGWNEYRIEWLRRLYLDIFPAEEALISPLRANLEGLAPMLIQAGETEPLVRDAIHLAERCKSCGVDVHLEQYAGGRHALPLEVTRDVEADRLVGHAARFLSTHLLK